MHDRDAFRYSILSAAARRDSISRRALAILAAILDAAEPGADGGLSTSAARLELGEASGISGAHGFYAARDELLRAGIVRMNRPSGPGPSTYTFPPPSAPPS